MKQETNTKMNSFPLGAQKTNRNPNFKKKLGLPRKSSIARIGKFVAM
jgi:hypothetical protein